MTTLIIDVAGRDAANQRFKQALNGQPQGEFLSFDSPAQLFQVLNARRWAVLEHVQEHGPLGLRALARAMAVDAGNLARDIKPLKTCGLVVDGPEGLRVPYDAIELRLELGHRAA